MQTRKIKIPSGAVPFESIAEASIVLRKGGIVAFPTETVYGLAVNLTDSKALQRLYKVKRRPPEKPLPVIVSRIEQIVAWTGPVSGNLERLLDTFLPGPLTLLLHVRFGPFAGEVRAFRMPDNQVALSLIRMAEVPLGGTSANVSGKTSPQSAADVEKSFSGMIDVILDDGKASLGRDSTIIDCTGQKPFLVRKGPIPQTTICAVWKGKG